MFFILTLLATAVLTSALEPAKKVELGDEKVRSVFSKYLDNIPDINEQYVMDERLSRVISHYYNGKLSAFPLFKVSVKIDRNPVKIPWMAGEIAGVANLKKANPKRSHNEKKPIQKRYKFLKTGNRTRGGKNKLRKSVTPKPIDKASDNVAKTNKSENPVQKKVYNLAIDSKDPEIIVQNNDSLAENQAKKSERIDVSEKAVQKDVTNKSPVTKINSTTMKIETTIARQDDALTTVSPPMGTVHSINTTK